MSKRPELTDLSTQYGAKEAFNGNNDAIREAFDNTLSRDGSTPNEMEADLDMNDNDILNANETHTDVLYVGGARVTALSSTPDWKGTWTTTTSYLINDIVHYDGATYICVEDHISGTFATDLGAGIWELFADQGASGAGTGDLLAANNLSDLANADTALTNLGGGTKGIAIFKDTTTLAVQTELGLRPNIDVQAYDALLKDIADMTMSAGDLMYYDGTDIVQLAAGTEGEFLRQGASNTPEWGTPSTGEPTRGTAVNTTSGTEHGFTGLPSGIKRISLILDGVGLSGTDDLRVQLGDSGGYEIGGYTGASVYHSTNNVGINDTQSFPIIYSVAGRFITGVYTIENLTGNVWVAKFTGLDETTLINITGAGRKTLSGTMDRIRIKADGSNTFNAGQINIIYE